MSAVCTRCPVLQTRIGLLKARNTQLQMAADHARRVLARLMGAVRSVAELIEDELNTPTMPRQRLVPVVRARLGDALDDAEGLRP